MNIKLSATPIAVIVTLIIATVAVSLAVLTSPASAHEGHEHEEEVVTQAADKKTTSDTTYKYVAQAGDSYSKLARKAVQTYGLKHKVNLAGSQIVYAETHLTQEAGSPLLNLGQEVSVSEKTVKSWVEKAQKLSDADKANWNAYTSDVNFNTNAVGQAS